MMEVVNFNEIFKIHEAVCETLPKDAQILDVGAGTGKLGRYLADSGYKTIDGIDACQTFLQALQATGAYRSHAHVYLGEGAYPTDEARNRYDCAVASGVFLEKHVPASGIPEVSQAIKSGGLFITAMRMIYW